MTPMILEVHSLASGSSGNAILVKAGGRGLLIDAGISARALVPALRRRGIMPGHLDGILLTHEHDDHIRGAGRSSRQLFVPVIGNRATLEATSQRTELGKTTEMATGAQIQLGAFLVRSFSVPHDAVDPVGYVIEATGATRAYATDVGCPCAALREAMRTADLCILESNHDVEWLKRGPYPAFMKARIASDRGHLSNQDAVNLIAERLEDGGSTFFWLAHLSAVNNSPALAFRYATQHLRSLTRVPYRLEVALRGRPSVLWKHRGAAVQHSLF